MSKRKSAAELQALMKLAENELLAAQVEQEQVHRFKVAALMSVDEQVPGAEKELASVRKECERVRIHLEEAVARGLAYKEAYTQAVKYEAHMAYMAKWQACVEATDKMPTIAKRIEEKIISIGKDFEEIEELVHIAFRSVPETDGSLPATSQLAVPNLLATLQAALHRAGTAKQRALHGDSLPPPTFTERVNEGIAWLVKLKPPKIEVGS